MNKIVACRKRRIILERDIPDVVVDLVFGDLSSALSMLVVSGPRVKKKSPLYVHMTMLHVLVF